MQYLNEWEPMDLERERARDKLRTHQRKIEDTPTYMHRKIREEWWTPMNEGERRLMYELLEEDWQAWHDRCYERTP